MRRTTWLSWRESLSSYALYVVTYLAIRALLGWRQFAIRGAWTQSLSLAEDALFTGVICILFWQLLIAFERRKVRRRAAA